MRKPKFRPTISDVLEDRVALSHVGVVHLGQAHPSASSAHVLKTATLNDVNRKIDSAFTQFTKEYSKEVTQAGRTGNQTKFQSDFGVSVQKLRTTLDKQAVRIPGGAQSLVTKLNATVDSLVHDLSTKSTQPSSDLIRSDQSGAHADVQTYVHDAVSKGDFSVK
jgi:hypothetical protein